MNSSIASAAADNSSSAANVDLTYLSWRKVAISKMVLSGTIACYRLIMKYMNTVKKHNSLSPQDIDLFQTMRQIMQEPCSHMMQWTDMHHPMYSTQQNIDLLLKSDMIIDPTQMMAEAMERVIKNAEQKIMHQKQMLNEKILREQQRPE